jgi:hypothetical protein
MQARYYDPVIGQVQGHINEINGHSANRSRPAATPWKQKHLIIVYCQIRANCGSSIYNF